MQWIIFPERSDCKWRTWCGRFRQELIHFLRAEVTVVSVGLKYFQFPLLPSSKAVGKRSFNSQPHHGCSAVGPLCPACTSAVLAAQSRTLFPVATTAERTAGLSAIALPCRNLVISWANKATLAIYLASYSQNVIVSPLAMFMANAVCPWLLHVHGVWPSATDFCAPRPHDHCPAGVHLPLTAKMLFYHFDCKHIREGLVIKLH